MLLWEYGTYSFADKQLVAGDGGIVVSVEHAHAAFLRCDEQLFFHERGGCDFVFIRYGYRIFPVVSEYAEIALKPDVFVGMENVPYLVELTVFLGDCGHEADVFHHSVFVAGEISEFLGASGIDSHRLLVEVDGADGCVIAQLQQRPVAAVINKQPCVVGEKHPAERVLAYFPVLCAGIVYPPVVISYKRIGFGNGWHCNENQTKQ